MTPAKLTAAIARDGFAIVPGVVPATTVAALLEALGAASETTGTRRKRDVYAMRNLLEAVPAVHDLAAAPALRQLIEPVLGPGCFAVRGILFDKIPEANWKVAWHQDLSIAVRRRSDVAGFGPWSQKAGVTHVQPPVAILEGMLALRLHLDDCSTDNGPLRVLPGTHRAGRFDAAAIQTQRAAIAEIVCCVPAGGALLLRPLLLHASSAAISPRHRRVVHLEYAAQELPCGLEWQEHQ